MRYLNKIIFLNSAHIPYAEVRLDGNVHFIGTQGVGKSTLLRAVLFFYNADKLHLGIPKEKKSFDAFYFPYANSYIVYEVVRENGAYCVLALKSQGRVMFRFIDAPYDSRWFMDEHRQVYGDWVQIRAKVGVKHQISALVSSYEMYRDIIFGNNRRQELMAYRKYAVVESPKYQNIPRTIQNVFLNTKLDADFIKDTIIRSMSDEDTTIDLNFYREQIKEFEQEYKDVSLWTEKNRNGEIVVRRMADKVIEAYRSLLNNRRLITLGRQELNYAERNAQELLPQYKLAIQTHEAECARLSRLKGEEQDKYRKERDLLSREIGVLDDQLKKTVEKRTYYERINIDAVLQRVEQEPAVEEERTRQEAMKAELEKAYKNVVDRYKALFDQLDMDLRAFETNRNAQLNERKSAFVEKKEALMKKLRKAETEERDFHAKKIEAVNSIIAQLAGEETSLKVQKAKIDQENPWTKEMEASGREMSELLARKTQVDSEINEMTLRIDNLRQEAGKELEIAELKYMASLETPRRLKAEVDAEIVNVTSLLERSRGSFSEWLDLHKADWQSNIGKVVDEESILYSNMLEPRLEQVSPQQTDSLYGVSINLAAIERKYRTPKELKEESERLLLLRDKYVKQLDDLQIQHEKDKSALSGKYQAQIKKQNETLSVLKAELLQVPLAEKRVKAQSLELKNRLEDWRKKQYDELDEKLNAIVAERVKKTEAKKLLDNDLRRKLNSLKSDYNKQVKSETDLEESFANDVRMRIAEKQKQTGRRKAELERAQYDELHGKGMDTSALAVCNKRIAELDAELAFIRDHREDVFGYRKDKAEYFDLEAEVRQRRKTRNDEMEMLDDKFRQRSEKYASQMNLASGKLHKSQDALKNLEAGLEAVKNFRGDETLCPTGSTELEEKATVKDCLAVVEELKRLIYNDGRAVEDTFKRQAQQFLGMFSAHNTFHFNTSPVTEDEYFAFASNLCEFVENDKIAEYQKRISGRYTDIILRISKEVGDLTNREGDINKTINEINRDFEERNFAGVIKEIALRSVKTNDRLMLLLLSIKSFTDENQYDIGEMDLFSTESRQDVNAKAVRYLLSFMKGLLDDPNRRLLQVSDTFKLEFRIKENDNDTGWVEKIANVGSDGTDILVKAMVNIMLINVFKEKASKKSGDFKIHCMMDEIGKLHPNNVKGILDFANRRNILLINSSPTTYNVEDYKYTYLLNKDGRANTKVVQLIKRL